MGLRINNNIAAQNAYRNLSVTDSQMSKSLEKLSSGFRINRAADDAAGLSISEGLRSQIGGLKVAVRNAQDGISVVQTAEGALTETHSILQRMRDLSVQAASTGSQDSDARSAAQTEFTQLNTELDRIATTTAFGGQKLGPRHHQQHGLHGHLPGRREHRRPRTRSPLTSAAAAFGAVTAVSGFDSTGLGVSFAGPRHCRYRGDRRDRHRHQGCVDRPGHARCLPEPLRAHHQQPEHRSGEPVRVGVAHPGHRHGPGDGVLHPLTDPDPGRHQHAGPGQPGAAERPLTAALGAEGMT